MPTNDPLAAFYLALEENPGDTVTLQALADWFEEQGEGDRAACLRWVVRKGYCPFRYSPKAKLVVSSTAFRDGWFWWGRELQDYARDWGHPATCHLPRKLWARLKHSFAHEPSVYKDYPTARAAYEALLAVWPLVGPADREKQP